MAKALKINPVPKTKIYKDILEQLNKFIFNGHLTEGNRLLTERQLADQFGVSRVSVRQALTVLHEMAWSTVVLEAGPSSAAASRTKSSPLSPQRFWLKKSCCRNRWK